MTDESNRVALVKSKLDRELARRKKILDSNIQALKLEFESANDALLEVSNSTFTEKNIGSNGISTLRVPKKLTNGSKE